MTSRVKFFCGVLLSNILILTGCGNNKIDYLTAEQAAQIDSTISSQISNNDMDIDYAQKVIKDSLKLIEDKDVASNVMNNYLYLLYNESEKYIDYLKVAADDINSIKKELEIDNIDTSMYKEFAKYSKVAGSILEEMDEKHLMIINEYNSYYVEVDAKKIISLYGDYLNSDLLEFLEFRANENSVEIFDVNSDKYNIDEILSRAAFSLEKVNKNKSSTQINNWISAAQYYYKILLATNIEQFLENENTIVKEDYLNELEKLLVKYDKTQLHTDMTGYIDVLRQNNNKINSDNVSKYREELLKSLELN